MKSTKIITLVVLLVSASTCTEKSDKAVNERSDKTKLTLAKTDHVCMPQDAVYHRKMIPVEVKGKTYYGCCQGCVEQIKKEPEKHCFAIDPISKEKVDKSEAIILNLWGKARYFISKENARKYAKDRGYETDF